MAVALERLLITGRKWILIQYCLLKIIEAKFLRNFQNQRVRRFCLQKQTFILSDILSDNFARQSAFGSQSDLVIPGYKVAVKQGTTNSKRDNWTDGYTRKFCWRVGWQ